MVIACLFCYKKKLYKVFATTTSHHGNPGSIPSPCGICSGQRGTGTDFSSSTSFSPVSIVGRDISVGIATGCGDRIPVGARFSAPVQTGPGAHPASYTMGAGSFSEVKRPGRGVDNPPNLAPRITKE
jgi:hypothetical protein